MSLTRIYHLVNLPLLLWLLVVPLLLGLVLLLLPWLRRLLLYGRRLLGILQNRVGGLMEHLFGFLVGLVLDLACWLLPLLLLLRLHGHNGLRRDGHNRAATGAPLVVVAVHLTQTRQRRERVTCSEFVSRLLT